MAPLKLETAIRAFRGRFFAIAFLLNWLWIGFLNDCFYGLELLAVQLFEHADRAAGTGGDDNHRRPQEKIPFFLGVVGLCSCPFLVLDTLVVVDRSGGAAPTSVIPSQDF